MKKYESVIILEPNLTQSKLAKLLRNIKTEMERNSKITKVQDMGIKKLAYHIKHNQRGHYVAFEFEIENQFDIAIKEIERYYKLQDEIMKFIVVKRG